MSGPPHSAARSRSPRRPVRAPRSSSGYSSRSSKEKWAMTPEDLRRPIRVAISDDHPVVRQGLRSFLEAQGFEVVGEAADGDEAVRLVESAAPDVLLTDVVMPGVGGIEVIRRLRASGSPVGLLVLTSFSGADQVIPAIQAGADGYLLKDAGPATLADAIRAVHRGDPMLAPEAAAAVMAKVADGPGKPVDPPAPNP